MNFKFIESTDPNVPSPVIYFGEDNLPSYDFELSESQGDAFISFGLYELMEGIFSMSDSKKKTEQEIREFLVSQGYTEV